MSGRFDEIYGEDGRRSIPPERLLRALLLQMLYSVRSERMLMEQLEYNLSVPLVRRAVGERAGLASDGIHEEPRPAAGRRGGGRVLLADRGTGAQPETAVGRTLHGGRNADRSVGRAEELSAQRQRCTIR